MNTINKNIIFFFVCTLFFVFSVACFANNAKDTGRIDKTVIVPRTPPQSTIDKYKADDDFKYTIDVKEERGLWDKIIRFLRKLFGVELNSETSEWVVKILKWLIIAIAIIGLGYLLFKNELKGFFTKNALNNQQLLKTEFLDLSMDNATIETLLNKAIKEKNYAEAVRLYYTLALKNLSEKGHIYFRVDKTNGDYVYEISNQGLQHSFKKLTYYFEYVFYGNFEATEHIYEIVCQNYEQLKKNSQLATVK